MSEELKKQIEIAEAVKSLNGEKACNGVNRKILPENSCEICPVLKYCTGKYSYHRRHIEAKAFLARHKPEETITVTKNSTVLDNPSVIYIDEMKKQPVGVYVHFDKDGNPIGKLPNPDLTTKLNKREMILKNKKDVIEVCDKALKLDLPEDLIVEFKDGKYMFNVVNLTPEQALIAANFILNLEKQVKAAK